MSFSGLSVRLMTILPLLYVFGERVGQLVLSDPGYHLLWIGIFLAFSLLYLSTRLYTLYGVLHDSTDELKNISLQGLNRRIIAVLPIFILCLIGIISHPSIETALGCLTFVVYTFWITSLIKFPRECLFLLFKKSNRIFLVTFIIGALCQTIFLRGDFLFTLSQIYFPYLLFCFSLIHRVERFQSKLEWVLLVVYLIILVAGFLINYANGTARIQFFPLGLSIIIACIQFPFLIVLSLPTTFTLITANSTWTQVHQGLGVLLEYRLMSFLDRVAVAKAMFVDSATKLLGPSGVGSSNKVFDIENFIEVERSRSLYPPHSGLMVLFFEVGVVLSIIFLIAILLQGVLVRGSSFKQFILLGLVFLLGNVFYIVAIPFGEFSNYLFFVQFFLASCVMVRRRPNL